MPSLTAGTPVTVSLDYNDSITISCNADVLVTPSAGSAFRTAVTGTQVLGPFKVTSSSVVITPRTDGSYTFSSDTRGDVPLTTDELVATKALVSGAGNGVSVVIFGDSMTQRVNGYNTPSTATRTAGVVTVNASGHGMGSLQLIDFDNATDATFNVRNVAITRVDANNFTFPASGPDGTAVAISGRALIYKISQQFNDDGYWFWLNAKLGGSLRLVKNAGISSNNSTDMLARVAADVLAYTSDWVFFQPTIYNDVVNAGYTLAQITALNAQILATLRAAGRKVLLIGPPAFTSGNTAALHAIWIGAQKWMREQARTLPNVYFADVYRYQVNATAGTPGNAIAGMLQGDNIHEAPRGAERKAQAISDAISSLIPRVNMLVASNGDNYGQNSSNSNILDFGPWTSSGGTINAASGGGVNSGVVGSGLQTDANLSAAGTSVWTMPARADGIGFDAQVVLTSTGVSNYALLRLATPISSTRFTAGQKLRVSFEVGISNLSGSNLRTINAYLQFAGTAANTSYIVGGQTSAAASWLQADSTLTIVSQDLIVPSDGITSCDLQIYFVCGAAGTAVTCKVGRMSIEKVA